MPQKDILQMKRKLKHPYVRKWYHGKGDDTYRQTKGTKAKLYMATLVPKREDVCVAYKGKEYHPKEFLRKHPSFKLKDKTQQAAIRKRFSKRRKRQ